MAVNVKPKAKTCRIPSYTRSIQVGMQEVMCLILNEPIGFEPHTSVWDVHGKLARVSRPVIYTETNYQCGMFMESWPECPDR